MSVALVCNLSSVDWSNHFSAPRTEFVAHRKANEHFACDSPVDQTNNKTKPKWKTWVKEIQTKRSQHGQTEPQKAFMSGEQKNCSSI